MKFSKNCPQCHKELKYSTKNNLDRAIKTNTPCKECSQKKRRISLERNCPNCGKILKYARSSAVITANKENHLCETCSGLKRRRTEPYTRNCPECGKLIIYKNKNCHWSAKKFNKKCFNCGRKIANLNLKRTAHQRRLSMMRRLEKLGNASPRINLNACKLFDQINNYFGWNGRHGTNGGEFRIKELGYWVDYYEPKLNLIIEYQEKWHKKWIKEDEERKLEIEKLLGCKFIFLNETESNPIQFIQNQL